MRTCSPEVASRMSLASYRHPVLHFVRPLNLRLVHGSRPAADLRQGPQPRFNGLKRRRTVQTFASSGKHNLQLQSSKRFEALLFTFSLIRHADVRG